MEIFLGVLIQMEIQMQMGYLLILKKFMHMRILILVAIKIIGILISMQVNVLQYMEILTLYNQDLMLFII